MDKKDYLLDSLANILFWTPPSFIFTFYVLHLSIVEVVSTMAYVALMNLAFGGLFGRFLNRWRKKLKYR